MNRSLTVDWLTAVLVGLMGAFQVGALVLLTTWGGITWSANQQTTNINIGFGFVAIIVAESLLLICVWRLWKRVPEWIRDVVKRVTNGAFAALTVSVFVLGVYLFSTRPALLAMWVGWCAISVAIVYRGVGKLKWILHDLVAFGLGVGIAVLIGMHAAPIVVIPILVGLILWDHYAVNLSDLMGDLVEFSTNAGIPNYLIIPNRLYVDLDALKDFIKDPENNEKPSGVSSIIGVGDFGIPTVLVTSAWVAGSRPAAVGAIVGTCIAAVALRDAMDRRDGGLPALPWVNTGAIGGYGVVTAVVMLSNLA